VVVVSQDEGVAPGRGRYHVVYERDPTGVWTVDVTDVPGCHTWGETVSKARRYVRDALALWVDDAATASLIETFVLPQDVNAAVEDSRAARARLEEDQREAGQRTEQAARQLVNGLGLGLRDAGEVLGLSYQRVQQIVQPASKSKPGKAATGQNRRASGRFVAPPPRSDRFEVAADDRKVAAKRADTPHRTEP
jgi:predicted RNase H-like HicB family nuclease